MVNLCHRQQCKLYAPVFEINYIATNWHSFYTLHINDALKRKNGCLFMAFFRRVNWLTDRNDRYVVRQFLVFLSVAVKRFTRSDGVNQLWRNTCQMLWPSVCILALVIRHAVLYWHLWPVRLYNIFPHYLINGTIFEKEKTLVVTKCVFDFCTAFVSNISHSKRN